MSDSRSRSRSPERGGGGGRDSPAYDDYDEKKKMEREDDEGVEMMDIDHAAAAFVLGRGGSTKRKIERVSECRLDLDEKRGTIELRGTKSRRDKARDYVNFVDQQRTGAVIVDVNRNDLTVVAVPEDCCGFVMGRGGATLRSMEEEWGTLMCFAKVDDREKLCIFGNFRARCVAAEVLGAACVGALDSCSACVCRPKRWWWDRVDKCGGEEEREERIGEEGCSPQSERDELGEASIEVTPPR